MERVQEQTRRLSREIGAARARGDATGALKSAMREQSRELAKHRDSLAGLEQQIDLLLDAMQQTHKPATGQDTAQPGERYRAPHAAGKAVTITLLEDELAAWNRYVADHPSASLYHRAEWRDLIANTFGHRGYYCVARYGNGQVAGILPLIRLQSRLFGDFIISVPYFNYGGPLGDSAEIETALIEFAARLAAELGVSHMELRDDVPREGMPARTDKVNMILSLPENEEQLWNGFSSKLRSQIKRSQREQPTAVCGGTELLDEFYSVFSRNMRDLGTPVYGKSFFRNILTTFPDECRILVARLGKRPVASGFLAASADRMEIPWASTIREVNHLSINMFLYWEVLKYAVEHGSRSFDFGRSSVDSGTFRFKQQWGAQPRQLYWHYWLGRDRELPALNPSNPRYALFIAAWKRLPVTLTRWLGPGIVKNLP